MGLFGVRRAPSKDHHQASDNILSPTKPNAAILANLFTDSFGEDTDDEKPLQTVNPTVPAEKNTSSGKRAVPISNLGAHGPRKSTVRISGKLGNGPPTSDSTEAMARMAHRDSIKRSISRKIARSESRRQLLNAKDDRSSRTSTATPSPLNGPKMTIPPAEATKQAVPATVEVKFAGMSLSPVTPALNVRDEDIPLAMEMDVGDEALALTCDMNTLSMGLPPVQSTNASSSARRSKSRRRPPPLLGGGEGNPMPDSVVDWPTGGFVTGGFKITAEGMVGMPHLQTRQDSDSDGEASVASRLRPCAIVVNALRELRAGPTIGSGAAGRVYIAEHTPTETTLAVKVVNVYSKEKRNQLLKELETLSTHISRYLVRFHGAFYDGSGAVHIALEYMGHGCLSTFIQRVGPIPERIVQMIAVDCLKGLRFLHRHHVLHRDFKTANILLSRKLCCAKLSDFGLARDLNPGVSNADTFVGTVAYMSPERLQGRTYTYASDIWALGVSIVECLIGRHPFNCPQNYFDYIEATAASGTLSGFDEKEKRFSKEVNDFVTLCTYTDPTKRPQAAELLAHPWLKGLKRDSDLFGSWLDECRTISMQVASRSLRADQ